MSRFIVLNAIGSQMENHTGVALAVQNGIRLPRVPVVLVVRRFGDIRHAPDQAAAVGRAVLIWTGIMD